MFNLLRSGKQQAGPGSFISRGGPHRPAHRGPEIFEEPRGPPSCHTLVGFLAAMMTSNVSDAAAVKFAVQLMCSTFYTGMLTSK